MRAPRLRFTLRRMMIAVAAVAILFGMTLGLWRRHLLFRRLADEFAKKAHAEMLKGFRVQRARFPTDAELRMGEEHFRLTDYYEELTAKYERAAARPWFGVEPDRPPPEWPNGVPREAPQSNRVPEQPSTDWRAKRWTVPPTGFGADL
jgi:hypothetical protein